MNAMLIPTLLLGLGAALPADLDWIHGDLEEAERRASAQARPILVYFWSNGSQHCSAMYQETLQSEETAEILGRHCLVSADVASAEGAALMREHGVGTLPTCLVLGPDGSPEDILIGYATPSAFAFELQRIEDGVGTVSALRGALAAAQVDAPGEEPDFAARLLLAGKLDDVGLDAEASKLRQSVRADDPQGRTVSGALALVDAAATDLVEDADGLALEPEAWDLRPLYRLAKRTSQPLVRYHSWNKLASLEASRDDREAAIDALAKAHPHVPTDELVAWCQQSAWFVMGPEVEVRGAHKRFLREITAQAVAHVEGLVVGEASDASRTPDPQKVWTKSREEYNAYLARQLDTQAFACYFTGDARTAIELARRCRELDPEYEEYAGRESFFSQPIGT
ncbi:MAG: thioredoxin family protein [Planctomycetota bacterium]